MTTITTGSIARRRSSGTKRRRHLRVVPEIPSTAGEGQLGLAVVFVLLVIGLGLVGSIMILSASSVSPALGEGTSSFSVFFKQCAWFVAGIAALAVGARIDYHRWARYLPALVLGSIVLLGLVLVPGIGVNVNGAQRWIGYGNLQLQPAEPVKLALVVFVAALVARQRITGSDLKHVVRQVVIVSLLVAALLMKQPNMGTTMVICATVGIMLLWAGVPMKTLAVLGATLAALAVAFATLVGYRNDRIVGFLDPWGHADDAGYQTIQSLIGVASGGVSGMGLGASRAKWGFLPEAHTDFVFAIIGEELGLAGSLVIVAMFAAMIVCGLKIAARASDTFGTMLAVGVTAWFAIQAFVNVGAVLNLLPITGVPLPFVSFGGSSLMTTMLAAGILVSVAVQGSAPRNEVRDRIAARRAANARRSAALPGER